MSDRPPPPPPPGDFHIAVICALDLEAEVVDSFFDTIWKEECAEICGNPYTVGLIGGHNVVLVWMPRMGKCSAASAAARVESAFRNIKLALVVGICAGVPGYTTGEEEPAEILLGDVIISTGIMQYDLGGKRLPAGYLLNVEVTNPNDEISSFLRKLGAHRERDNLNQRALRYLEDLRVEKPYLKSEHLGPGEDKLYKPDYLHKHHDQVSSSCDICADPNNQRDCETAYRLNCKELKCSEEALVPRKRLGNLENLTPAAQVDALKPVVHFGLVASGDTVMRSGQHRDGIACRGVQKPIAFEMEAAGVWNVFPGSVVVIKGVCDYADSHKNKRWQHYAAVTGGVYMRAFLDIWIPARKLSVSEGALWTSPLLAMSEPSIRALNLDKPEFKESIKSFDISPMLNTASPVETPGGYFEPKPGSISSREAPNTVAVHGEKVQEKSLGTEQLFTACRQRKIEDVKKLLRAQDVDLSAWNRDGWNMLHLAIGEAKVHAFEDRMLEIAAIVRLLCLHGADVDAKDGCGLGPIHYCVKSMNIKAAKCLLEFKANVNLLDALGRTALYIMTEESYPVIDFAKMLLKKGGNLGQKELQPLPSGLIEKRKKVRALIKKYQGN